MAAALVAGGNFYLQKHLPPRVETVAATRGPAVEAVYATGTVEASVMLPIAARTTARLLELNADEGDSVAAGTVMARLEDTDLQKTLEEQKAKAELAEKNFTRREILAKKGYEAKAVLDQARADLEVARAAVARTEAEIGYMRLMAPADGLVIRRDGEIGQMIAANQPVFWMSCCAPLRISAEVDEEDIARVKPGQETLISADAFPGQVFKGQVQSITPKGDPVARSYRVRISFPAEVDLRIGMTAEANIIIHQTQDALLLPNSAIAKDNTVWVVKDGKIFPKEVKVGARGDAQTEIQGGISVEDRVVRKAEASFMEGMTVRTTAANVAKEGGRAPSRNNRP